MVPGESRRSNVRAGGVSTTSLNPIHAHRVKDFWLDKRKYHYNDVIDNCPYAKFPMFEKMMIDPAKYENYTTHTERLTMSLFECQFICVLKGYSCNFLRYNESSQDCIWGKVGWWARGEIVNICNADRLQPCPLLWRGGSGNINRRVHF